MDQRLFEWIVAHRMAWLDGAMLALSVISQGGRHWLVVGGVLAVFGGLPLRALVQLGLAILLATVLADHVLKPAFNRLRPYDALSDVPVIGDRPDGASFPSGHSSNAFAGALVLSRALPQASVAWWATACAVAFSRVYLGVHYPADVIGGAVVGIACGVLSLLVVRRRE